MIVVDVIGETAGSALARVGGEARVLARTTSAIWLTAGGEIVWLGRGGGPHPRAMLTASVPDVPGDVVRIDARAAHEWRPARPALDARGATTLRAGAGSLRARLAEVGTPDGLAILLPRSGPPPAEWSAPVTAGLLAEVLAHAAPAVAALAAAAGADRTADAVEPAIRLLGLGPGLTPAGDDFVGGLLFAQHLLADADVADPIGWRAAADAIRRAAGGRTHPISAALLGDLAEGRSHAALHDLVAVLATGGNGTDAARRLTRIGHSSGWDILAGFLTALG